MGGFNGLAEQPSALAISTINWSFLLGHALLPILSLVIFLFMNVEKENRKLREG